MRRLLLAGLVVAGCAPAIKATPPPASNTSTNAAMANAQAQMMAMQAARLQAEQSCAFLKTREPDAREERLVGALMASQQLKSTGTSLLLDPSVEGERKRIFEELDQGTLEALPPGPRGSLTFRVAEVGHKLAKASSRPELPWIFGVAKSESERTFSAPGGYVFITTGLLKKVTNEAQLAGLLGHELGHVVKKHQLHAYRDASAQMCVLSKSLSAASASMPAAPAQLEALKFADRFQEPLKLDANDSEFVRFLVFTATTFLTLNQTEQVYESDRVALELLGATNYAAAEYETIVAALPKDSFAPEPAARLAKLQALREGALKPVLKGTAKPAFRSE
jgi:Zn-dependent protease with chaperone function